MAHQPEQVDVNVPRFNQALVAVLSALAFVLDLPIVVVGLFFVLAASYVLGPGGALFTQLYVRAVRPRLGRPVEFEDARPPRFAQLIGSLFLGGASLLFAFGLTTAGWAVTLVVTALAALAAATRICVGCIVYTRVVSRA